MSSQQRGQHVPSYLELKQILYRNPSFQPATILTLDTSNRVAGTPLNNPSWNLPIPVKGAYAVALKSISLPVTWPNVTRIISFEVKYGAVTPFPGNFVLPNQRFSYNLHQGVVTYTMANSAPISDYQDDLVYYILRWFSGAVESITINPSSGMWTWAWDASCVSVTVDNTNGQSNDVYDFFRISHFPDGLTWQSNGTVDLTGPKLIMIGSPLAQGTYVASSTNSQNYLCSCPVGDREFGDLLSHEPSIEHITWFGMTSKFISSLTLSIVDAATNLLLPLTADWSVELKFYVEVQQ